MLILLVGLQAIPADVYEAAAHRRRQPLADLPRITLPLLRPSLALALILCVTGSLLAFDQFYILTKGGPDNSTVTVVQLIYAGVPAAEPRHRGGPLDHRPGRAARDQRRPVPRAAPSAGAAPEGPRCARALAGRTPYYVLTGGLAIIFLFPLIWTRSPRSAPSPARPGERLGLRQLHARCCNYGAGLWRVPRQQRLRLAADGRRHAGRVAARRLRLRPVHVPGPEPAVPADAGDPDGPVRDAADPAVRAAQRPRAAELAARAARWSSRCSSCRSRPS